MAITILLLLNLEINFYKKKTKKPENNTKAWYVCIIEGTCYIMLLRFKKTFVLSSMLLLTLFLTISCMYVKTLDSPLAPSSREISLNLNRLNNVGGTSADCFESVIESDNYYITVGYSQSDLSGLTGGSANFGNYNFVIAKFNKSDLSLISINNFGGGSNDYFESIIESDGYYIAIGGSLSSLSGFTGGSANGTFSYYFVIAKFNKSDLSLVSINNFGGTSDDYFNSAIESDEYYIAVGYSQSDLSGLTGGSANAGIGKDFVIAKFNKADLSLVSLNNLGGTSIDDFSSVIESNGYYIAAGASQSDLSSLTGGSPNSGNSDFVIAKFNKSDLSLNSINNFGGTLWDSFESIIVSDDYYIAVGYSQSDLSGYSAKGGNNTAGGADFVIAKFNKSDLSIVSINNLGGIYYDYFESIIESGGYYIAVGRSESDLSGFKGGSSCTGDHDFVIVKFNKTDLSLVSLNNLGGTDTDYFKSVIESDGYYITIGYSLSDLSGLTGGSNTQGGYDFTIIKFGD